MTTGSLLRTLPGRYYVDPQTFAREQEVLFERMWFCAVRAGDLPEPGSFRKWAKYEIRFSASDACLGCGPGRTTDAFCGSCSVTATPGCMVSQPANMREVASSAASSL